MTATSSSMIRQRWQSRSSQSRSHRVHPVVRALHWRGLAVSLSRGSAPRAPSRIARMAGTRPVRGHHAVDRALNSPRKAVNTGDLATPDAQPRTPEAQPRTPATQLCTPITELGCAAEVPRSTDRATRQAMRGTPGLNFEQPCIGDQATLHRSLTTVACRIERPGTSIGVACFQSARARFGIGATTTSAPQSSARTWTDRASNLVPPRSRFGATMHRRSRHLTSPLKAPCIEPRHSRFENGEACLRRGAT